MPRPPQQSSTSSRARGARELVCELLHRRRAGEAIDHDEIRAAHPELMPELDHEMRKLNVIREACLEAESRSEANTAGNGSQAASTVQMALPPADSFPGYEIERQIHRGGQGLVFQAVQRSTGRKVAIKVIREGPFSGPHDKARLEQEVHILGTLNHPHIVTIHDSGMAAGQFYFVMDYIPGQRLDAYMSDSRLSLEHTLRLFEKICHAVNAAHLRGVIHRDLKPGNIRVDVEGEPHILDFGLAKIVPSYDAEASAETMTAEGQFIGSLPWATPEQVG